MGPALYSYVVYQGPELGVILTSKLLAPLRCSASKTSSVGVLECSSPDQQRIEPSFLSTQVCIFLKKIQDLVPEIFAMARLAEAETHIQSELTNTFELGHNIPNERLHN